MLKDRIGKELLFFDGGMGTLLQEKGLKPGELPELWNIERPEAICQTIEIIWKPEVTSFLQIHLVRIGVNFTVKTFL